MVALDNYIPIWGEGEACFTLYVHARQNVRKAIHEWCFNEYDLYILKKNQREGSQMMLIYKAEEDTIFINYL